MPTPITSTIRKAVTATSLFLLTAAAAFAAPAPAPRSGALDIVDKHGRPLQPCPLKRTDAKADITGFLARVTVTQNFENPLNENIEAVYTFPLPQHAAVDDMTMWVGDRVIKGKIKPREEAKAIYDAARNSGRTASLLEQERPNIFTQSVANIRPGEKVKIVISYVETLQYEAGSYEFVFPMVVGPRYIPGKSSRVPDASRITPGVTPPGTRAGHDITLEVNIDAGVPIDGLACKTHPVNTTRADSRRATVKLQNQSEIPNKDFVLKYDVAGRKIEDAVLTHNGSRGGFFTLILQPPDRSTPAEITPKELVFVVDTSGSMHGFPLDKCKELMRTALTHMNPRDTFNLITFAGDTHILFPAPVPATAENVEKARQFMESRRGGGGTEMMKAIRAAFEPTRSQEHIRVVAFLTDGYVGNDMEIIGEVKKYSNARVFSFGIGNSVNRFLLDGMAEHGRGEVEYVTLQDDGSAAAQRFFERMRNPLLTDIQVEWNGLPVTDIYPLRIPDMFSAKPVIVHGRFTGAASGSIRITGRTAAGRFSKNVALNLPASEPRHDVLASLWARTKISHLMANDYNGVQRGTLDANLRNEITKLGLDFRLMTQFTAFVAVEERTVSEGNGKPPRRIEVPVEMPAGVSYEGVFGSGNEVAAASIAPKQMMAYRTRGMMPEARHGGYLPATPSIAGGPRQEVATDAAVVKAVTQTGPKLHPDLVAALAKPAAAGTKAEIRVYLNQQDAATLQALRALGFELVKHEPSNQLVIGRVALNKLEALSRHQAVRYISPR